METVPLQTPFLTKIQNYINKKSWTFAKTTTPIYISQWFPTTEMGVALSHLQPNLYHQLE